MTDIFEKCKRTHYSNEIGPELAGETVKVTGWVHEIRDLGGIVFVLIRDKNGITQLTAPSKKLSEEMMADVRAARKETIITLTGTVQESAKAPNGVEIIPSNIDVINVSQLPLPLDTTEKVEAEMDTRLDSRFMDLRKHDVSAIFKILSAGKNGEIYNISNEKSVASIAEVAKMCAEIAGTTVVFDLPDEIEEKGFSRSKNCILDNTKLRKLGWNGKFTLRDGLTETLAYLKDE